MNVQVVLKMDSKPKVMVFQPSMDEFKDFPRFVEHMENAGAHKIGLAKVLADQMQQLNAFVDTAHVMCGAVYETVESPSVCPSVCLIS